MADRPGPLIGMAGVRRLTLALLAAEHRRLRGTVLRPGLLSATALSGTANVGQTTGGVGPGAPAAGATGTELRPTGPLSDDAPRSDPIPGGAAISAEPTLAISGGVIARDAQPGVAFPRHASESGAPPAVATPPAGLIANGAAKSDWLANGAIPFVTTPVDAMPLGKIPFDHAHRAIERIALPILDGPTGPSPPATRHSDAILPPKTFHRTDPQTAGDMSSRSAAQNENARHGQAGNTPQPTGHQFAGPHDAFGPRADASAVPPSGTSPVSEDDPAEFPDSLRIDEDGIGFDSLARLEVVATFNRVLDLQSTGIEDYLLVRPTIGDWVELVAEHLRRTADDTRITFATSGSSGDPKFVTHRRQSLEREAASLLSCIPGLAPAGRDACSAKALTSSASDTGSAQGRTTDAADPGRHGTSVRHLVFHDDLNAETVPGAASVASRRDPDHANGSVNSVGAGDLSRPVPGRILALVPAHHIYGFMFTILLAERAGAAVVDLTGHGPAAVFRIARAGDLIVGTPFTWGVALASGGAFAPGVCGVTSSAPASPGLFRDAVAAGLERMTEIYGATETGGIGYRHRADDPFELLPHLQRDGEGVRARRRPDPDPDPADARAASQGGNGEPGHASPLPAMGPSRVQSTVSGDAGSSADHETADDGLPLQDVLRWKSETRFAIAGRVDAMVQVGGVNVSPERVRLAILRCAGVADAAVRLDGARLKAFVVPRSAPADPADFADALRAELARQLSAPERPQRLTFGSALPRDRTGKLTDWPNDPGMASAAD